MEEIFPCVDCGFTGTSPQSLQMHIQRVHKEMGPGHDGHTTISRVECSFCGASVSKSFLTRHVRIHHKNQPNSELVLRGVPKTKASTFKVMDGFVLLQDEAGGIWLAEKIK